MAGEVSWLVCRVARMVVRRSWRRWVSRGRKAVVGVGLRLLVAVVVVVVVVVPLVMARRLRDGLKRLGVRRVVSGERSGRRMVRMVRAGETGRERVEMVMCS